MKIEVDAAKTGAEVSRIYIKCGGVELAYRRVGEVVDINAEGDGDIESLKALVEKLAEVLG